MPRLALLDSTKTGKQAEDLENKLRHFVVGQEEAIHQIVRAYQNHLAGLSPVGRPIGNFLFLGPTGSGKTRIAEATAETVTVASGAPLDAPVELRIDAVKESVTVIASAESPASTYSSD